MRDYWGLEKGDEFERGCEEEEGVTLMFNRSQVGCVAQKN